MTFFVSFTGQKLWCSHDVGWWLYYCMCMYDCLLPSFKLKLSTTVKHKAWDCTDNILLSRSQQTVNLLLMITDCDTHQPTSMIITGRLLLFVVTLIAGIYHRAYHQPGFTSATILCHLRKTQHSQIHYDLQRLCFHFHIYCFIVSNTLCISVLRSAMLSTHALRLPQTCGRCYLQWRFQMVVLMDQDFPS